MAGISIQDIKDFHDVIRLLEEHPEWRAELRRVVLTDDLLALPVQVAQLTEQVTALAEAQRRTDAHLATLTDQVAALTRATQVLTEDVGTLKADTSTLKADTSTLKADTSTLKTDVGELKTDTSILKTDTSILKTDVGTLKTDVGTLKTDVGELKTDTSILKTDTSILKTDVGTLKTDVGTLKTDVGTLKTDVGELKTDVSILKTDTSILKTDSSTLKTDVGELKTDVSILKTDTSILKTDSSTLKTDVGELKGRSLENHYRAYGSPFFGVLLRHPYVLSRSEVTDLLDEAVDRGLLSQDDAVEVQRADLVVHGTRRTDGTAVYLVVEVSWTVDTDDVERAAQRAAFLAKTGHIVMPVVAGEKINPAAARLAHTRHVWQVTNEEVVPPVS